MKVLLVEQTNVLAATAPGKLHMASVVCFEDSFYIFLHVQGRTFHVDDLDPTPSYGFGDKSVAEGLQDLITNSSSEDELKGKLNEIIQNNTLIINFADYKKVKVKGFIGTKTLKASNNAMSYVSFNVGKPKAKELVEFYPNF